MILCVFPFPNCLYISVLVFLAQYFLAQMFPALNHLDFTLGCAFFVLREAGSLTSSYSLSAKGRLLVCVCLAGCSAETEEGHPLDITLHSKCVPSSSLTS